MRAVRRRSGGKGGCKHGRRTRKRRLLVCHRWHFRARKSAGRGIEFDFEYAIGSSQRLRQARALDTLTALATETVDSPRRQPRARLAWAESCISIMS